MTKKTISKKLQAIVDTYFHVTGKIDFEYEQTFEVALESMKELLTVGSKVVNQHIKHFSAERPENWNQHLEAVYADHDAAADMRGHVLHTGQLINGYKNSFAAAYDTWKLGTSDNGFDNLHNYIRQIREKLIVKPEMPHSDYARLNNALEMIISSEQRSIIGCMDYIQPNDEHFENQLRQVDKYARQLQEFTGENEATKEYKERFDAKLIAYLKHELDHEFYMLRKYSHFSLKDIHGRAEGVMDEAKNQYRTIIRELSGYANMYATIEAYDTIQALAIKALEKVEKHLAPELSQTL